MKNTITSVVSRVNATPARRLSGASRLVRTVGVGLVVGLALAACESEDRVEATIREASGKLVALMPASMPPPGPRDAATQLEGIIRSLSNLSGARPGQQAAASLLISRANVGLGLIPSTESANFERQRTQLLATISVNLNQWTSLKGHEVALLEFDPQPELADLDRQIAELNREVTQGRADKSALEQQVAALRSASNAAMAKAREQRLLQSQLEQRVASVTAVEGAELMRKALEHRRMADGHEAQAADIDAQAASVAPEVPAAQLNIDRLLGQITLLEEGKAQVNRRATLKRERAGASNSEAQQVATAIADGVAQVRALHPGDLASRYEDAERFFRAAVTAADRAASVSRAEAAVAKGEALHALGGTLSAKSQGLAAVAEMLSRLGEATPALPQAQQYASAAQEYRSFANDARVAAGEALKGAVDAFRSANLSGDAGASLGRTSLRILSVLEKIAPDESEYIQQERDRLAPSTGN